MPKDSRWPGKYNVRDGNPFKTGHISRNMAADFVVNAVARNNPFSNALKAIACFADCRACHQISQISLP
jgi:hypothetical protein